MRRYRFPKYLTDRTEAGLRLASQLMERDLHAPLVYAIPRGGVPVAIPIAQTLNAPLDLLLVRKLSLPGSPPMEFGALAEGVEKPFINLVARTGLTKKAMSPVIMREQAELNLRLGSYVEGYKRLEPLGRTVILVDDGIDSGITARAALYAIRQKGAARLILALPIANDRSRTKCRPLADEVITAGPERTLFFAAPFCQHQPRVSDSEMLRSFRSYVSSKS